MNKEISVAALKLLYPIALMAAVAAMATESIFRLMRRLYRHM